MNSILDLRRASAVLEGLGYVAGPANWVSPIEAVADQFANRLQPIRRSLARSIAGDGDAINQEALDRLKELEAMLSAYETTRWPEARPMRSLKNADITTRGEDAVTVLGLLGYQRDGANWKTPEPALKNEAFIDAADKLGDDVSVIMMQMADVIGPDEPDVLELERLIQRYCELRYTPAELEARRAAENRRPSFLEFLRGAPLPPLTGNE